PTATAVTAPGRRTVAVLRPAGRLIRTIHPCSLHATQAVLPATASVMVGQYAPAPAHARSARASGTLPAATRGAAEALPAAAAIASVPASVSAASRMCPPQNYLRARTTLATNSQYVQSYHPGHDGGPRRRPLAGALFDRPPGRSARRRGTREGRRPAPAVLVPRLDRQTAAGHP